MAKVDAIVFDSNIFGKDAIPNIAVIERWAEACLEHEAELWIPEVVAYELAEHAVAAERGFLESYERLRKRRVRIGLPSLPAIPTMEQDEVVEAMEAAGAVIVALPEDAAREAVFDQVRQRGAGSRKSDVKTGAADSGWIRSILAGAADNGDSMGDGLVIVTGDVAALQKTCEFLEIDPPRHVASIRELRSLLGEEGPVNEDLLAKLDTLISDRFQSNDFSGADFAEMAGLQRSRGNWWDVEQEDDEYGEWEFQESYVTPERSFEILGTPLFDGWSQTVVADVRLEAMVEEQFARQDRWGDEPEYRALMYPAAVSGRLAFTIEDDNLEADWVMEDPQLESVPAVNVVHVTI